SVNFPITPASYQTKFGGGSRDAFAAKLNASGAALIYSTYLGGDSQDAGYGIAVDSSGNAYVCGSTSSANFPITAGAYQTTIGGGGNAFATKLNVNGDSLEYSTYLGGALANSVAVDALDNAYLTGIAGANFPTTENAFQRTPGGDGTDAFVTKI